MIDRASIGKLLWAIAKPRGYIKHQSAFYKESDEITGALSYSKQLWGAAGIDIWVGMQFTTFVAARIPPHDGYWSIRGHAGSIPGGFHDIFDRLCLRNDDACTAESLREPLNALLDWCEEHVLNVETLKSDLRNEAAWTKPAMKVKEIWPWLETGIVPPPDEAYLKGR